MWNFTKPSRVWYVLFLNKISSSMIVHLKTLTELPSYMDELL